MKGTKKDFIDKIKNRKPKLFEDSKSECDFETFLNKNRKEVERLEKKKLADKRKEV